MRAIFSPLSNDSLHKTGKHTSPDNLTHSSMIQRDNQRAFNKLFEVIYYRFKRLIKVIVKSHDQILYIVWCLLCPMYINMSVLHGHCSPGQQKMGTRLCSLFTILSHLGPYLSRLCLFIVAWWRSFGRFKKKKITRNYLFYGPFKVKTTQLHLLHTI